MSRSSSMQPPPPPLHIPQNSKKKRVCMDAEVIEIPPPDSQTLKALKRKEINHKIIDVDTYEDSRDVIILGEKVNTRNKGKAIKHDYDGFGYYKPEVSFSNHLADHIDVKSPGSLNCVSSSESHIPGSDNLVHENSNLFNENEYFDIWSEDSISIDHYAMLQAHFDSMDIPAGVEATIPWYPDLIQGEEKTVDWSVSFHMPGQGIDPALSAWSLKPAYCNMNPITGNNLSWQVPSNPSGGDVSSPWLLPDTAYNSKNQAPSQLGKSSLNHLSASESSESQKPLQSSRRRSKTVGSSSSTSYSSIDPMDTLNLLRGVKPSKWGYYDPISVKEQNLFPPFFAQTANFPSMVPPSSAWYGSPFSNHTIQTNIYDPFDNMHISSNDESTDCAQDTPTNQSNVNGEDIQRKFQLFKQFDTAEDYSDHYYASIGSSTNQPSKKWAKKIQEEWRILEKDLPDTIFVRVYESRMDILRAAIIGAEGTPYHDGLFFFDVFFPDAYPNVPPHVHYHSGGLRLNPNLYNCGKVCLSLLNTWGGNKNERWIPGMSTVLQVLVSIQALILNQKPFFNEPGYERMSGSPNGELQSQKYNEDIFILSLKTMLYTIRRPPKNFHDFVVGHFYNRAHDVLVACKAYIDGAQVGCLVKGGVQDVDAGDKSCSKRFKDSLMGLVDMLVKAFSRIGAKDCEKFLTGPSKANTQVVDKANTQVIEEPGAAAMFDGAFDTYVLF